MLFSCTSDYREKKSVSKIVDKYVSFASGEELPEKTKAFFKRYWFLKPFLWLGRFISAYSFVILCTIAFLVIPILLLENLGAVFPKNISDTIYDVLWFYGKCLLLLIPYGLAKNSSNELDWKMKLLHAVMSPVIIGVVLVFLYAMGEEEDANSYEWWRSDSGISIFLYCLIAAWIGIAASKKKDKTKIYS